MVHEGGHTNIWLLGGSVMLTERVALVGSTGTSAFDIARLVVAPGAPALAVSSVGFTLPRSGSTISTSAGRPSASGSIAPIDAGTGNRRM